MRNKAGTDVRRVSLYLKLKQYVLSLQQRWPALYIMLSLVVSGLMLALFSELAWQTIFRQATGAFDNLFIWLVRYFASSSLDPIMIVITNLGFGYTFSAVITATFLILIIYRRWLEVKTTAICLGGAMLLNYLLKNLFERARPDAFRLVEALGYSFPSGHAMVSLCFYGMAAFLIARNAKSWHMKISIMLSAVFLILAIGISRIYLGVHYPSDVVAGYMAGAMWLAFCISLLMLWERKRR